MPVELYIVRRRGQTIGKTTSKGVVVKFEGSHKTLILRKAAYVDEVCTLAGEYTNYVEWQVEGVFAP